MNKTLYQRLVARKTGVHGNKDIYPSALAAEIARVDTIERGVIITFVVPKREATYCTMPKQTPAERKIKRAAYRQRTEVKLRENANKARRDTTP